MIALITILLIVVPWLLISAGAAYGFFFARRQRSLPGLRKLWNAGIPVVVAGALMLPAAQSFGVHIWETGNCSYDFKSSTHCTEVSSIAGSIAIWARFLGVLSLKLGLPASVGLIIILSLQSILWKQ